MINSEVEALIAQGRVTEQELRVSDAPHKSSRRARHRSVEGELHD